MKTVVTGINQSALEETQQTRCKQKRCSPEIVGERVAQATLSKQPYLWFGPQAKAGINAQGRKCGVSDQGQSTVKSTS